MPDNYHIRPARIEELPQLQEIERAAGSLFRDTEFSFLADSDPLPLDSLVTQQQSGLVWVVTDAGDHPVGFAVVRLIDGLAHLHELDVHPAHGRRGLGRRLTLEVCEWAKQRGFPAVTLSTFRDLAWNAPFYARSGFRILGEEELSPGLIELRKQEAQHGLPIERRVCMRYDC
jgi:ribosomal protein S18 acetylase RimI-like enzyme